MKRCPSDITGKARILFREFNTKWSLDTEHYLVVEEICRIVQRLEQIRETIQIDGFMIKNPSGIRKIHPLLRIEHEASNRLIGAWKTLNLGEHSAPSIIKEFSKGFG